MDIDGATSKEGLQERIAKMADDMLANPVIEDYEISWDSLQIGESLGDSLGSPDQLPPDGLV